MRRIYFTLIELIAVIVVLGILAAIIVQNISGFKKEADLTALQANIRNLQTATDHYYTKNKELPILEEPDVGKPKRILFSQLKEDYIRNIDNRDYVYYWIDFRGTVWGSTVDAPLVREENGEIVWKEVAGAEGYRIYAYDETKTTSSLINSEVKLKELGFVKKKGWLDKEDTFNLEEVKSDLKGQFGDYSNKHYLISAIDENGLSTAPVSLGYQGMTLQYEHFVPNSPLTPPVAVIKMYPEKKVTSQTEVYFDSLSSYDINGDEIVKIEWENNKKTYPQGGHTVRLRVQDESGMWSEWVEKTFNVLDPKEISQFITSPEDKFEDKISYDDTIYIGTLLRFGESDSRVVSGAFTPEEKRIVSQKVGPQISNSFSSVFSYNKDGFIGEIHLKGTPFVDGNVVDKKTVSQTQKGSNMNFSSTLNYNNDGYVGILNAEEGYTSEVISGSYTPSDTKTASQLVTRSDTNFASAISYNSGGYSGSLSKAGGYSSKVISGTYTPSDSFVKTDSRTSSFNSFSSSLSYNSGGYSGTLYTSGSSYVISGTASGSKTISNYGDTYQGKWEIYCYNSTAREWRYSYSRTVSPYITQYYNYSDAQGYTGQLNATYVDRGPESFNSLASNPYNGQCQDYRHYVNHYKYNGTVTKPDTRVWQQNYSGTVTKPASDNRVYEYTQNYSGSVTKAAIDTRVYEYTKKYSGEVTKTTPTYSQMYEGEVVKPSEDTRVYQYIQEYRGIVEAK